MTPPIRMVSVPVEPTDEMIRASLAVEFPATYRDHLRHPDDGPKSQEVTAQRIERERKRWSAMLTAAPVREEGGAVETALKIATDLHHAYEQLIYGLPKYLEAENLTDEENMIREAWITLDVTAHRIAALTTREEAPAEAGSLEARPEREDYLNPNLRTQPQAREEGGACDQCGQAVWVRQPCSLGLDPSKADPSVVSRCAALATREEAPGEAGE